MHLIQEPGFLGGEISFRYDKYGSITTNVS